MKKNKHFLIILFSLFIIGSCADGSSEESNIEEEKMEQIRKEKEEKEKKKDQEEEVSEENLQELESVQSTNDSLVQLEKDVDDFIESINN